MCGEKQLLKRFLKFEKVESVYVFTPDDNLLPVRLFFFVFCFFKVTLTLLSKVMLSATGKAVSPPSSTLSKKYSTVANLT